MSRKGKHLTWNERLIIERMLMNHFSKKDIAAAIGCCLATIYNEIKRGKYEHYLNDWSDKTETRYSPDKAQISYDEMIKKKGVKAKLKKDPELAKTIESYIVEKKYSPKATLIEMEKNDEFGEIQIKSVNTVYSGIRKGYFPRLKLEHCPDRGRHGKVKGKVKRAKSPPKGQSINLRPDYINERKTFGHWEMDTIHGKMSNKKCVLTLTERLARVEILEQLDSCTKDSVRRALNRLEKRFGSSFYNIFKTITIDNGNEFADFKAMEKALYRKGKRTTIYYCQPYRADQRGSNENSHKLLRRWLPKGSDFDKYVTQGFLDSVEDWINNYPREIFHGKSSYEILEEQIIRGKMKAPG